MDRVRHVFSGDSVRSEIQHAPVNSVTGPPVDLTAAVEAFCECLGQSAHGFKLCLEILKVGGGAGVSLVCSSVFSVELGQELPA